MELIFNFWQLLVTAAPWLLAGFAVAGLIHAFVPKDLMSKYLGADGFASTVKAALIGAPLPLCSCGVIPAALGLRRSGASKSATVSFLVATPETGVDSVSVSYALLGPIMAVVRPVAAICSAIVAGVLVGREERVQVSAAEHVEAKACCSKQAAGSATPGGSGPGLGNLDRPTFAGKLWLAVCFSTGKLVADTAWWLVIGLFFAALVQTYVPTAFLAAYGEGILAMALMVLVSIPMYICATASTPIAVGLLFAGVSPGAILVFMLAGPATNMATLGVVAKELGKRPLMAYLVGVIATAMLFGAALDFGLDYFAVNIREGIEQHSHFVPEVVSLPLAWVLVALLARAFFNKVRARLSFAGADTAAKKGNL
ncbi:MAG: SO_0444 family Cu/Zn efflux transporter [Pseudomonadales bacterium]